MCESLKEAFEKEFMRGYDADGECDREGCDNLLYADENYLTCDICNSRICPSCLQETKEVKEATPKKTLKQPNGCIICMHLTDDELENLQNDRL